MDIDFPRDHQPRRLAGCERVSFARGCASCASRIPNSLAESRIEAPLRGAWRLAHDNEVRSHASLKGHTPLTFGVVA